MTTPQQNPAAKPRSKTAIAKAQAAERRCAREAKAISDAARLIAAREAAAKITKAMPAAYAEWGVVRTRAYIQLVEIISAKAWNSTMKADRLEKYLAELARASQWTLEYCQHLAMLHARAAEIGSEAAAA